MGVQPGDIAGVMLMQPWLPLPLKPVVPLESVWEIVILAKVGSPPRIMEEVPARVVFHRVLDGRRWVPEGRTRWLARFELGGTLAQDDAPESRR